MIYELVNDCIENETEHGIGKTTLKELSRNLHEFSDYCQQNPIINFEIKNFSKALNHGWRKSALSSFVITNHILTNTKFCSELSLGEPCLQPGA